MTKAKKKLEEDFKKMTLDLNKAGQSLEDLSEQYVIAINDVSLKKALYKE